MDFLTVLRKIGLLRWGVKKYSYTSGREIPPEALMDGVYNAEHDLVITGEAPGKDRPGDGKKDARFPSSEEEEGGSGK